MIHVLVRAMIGECMCVRTCAFVVCACVAVRTCVGRIKAKDGYENSIDCVE